MKKIILFISLCMGYLTSSAQISSTVTIQNVTCFGQCDGVANITASGGIMPYTYTLMPSSMTGTFTSMGSIPNLCASSYTVIVADAALTTTTSTFMIVQPNPLSLFMNSNNVSCGGNSDGAVFGMANGGTPPFNYMWTPGGAAGPVYQNASAGMYTLTVIDINGCMVSSTAVVNTTGTGTLSGVTTTLTSYQETCLYSGDGAIDLTVAGSNPGPFTYQWNTGATTQDITNIVTNTYSVTIFDAAMNCMTYTSAITANGTNCGSVNGNVFIDNNSDCVKNTGDNNLTNGFVIANPGNHYGYTNNNGDYFINNLPYGTYSLSIGNIYSGLIPSCTTTINTTINSGQPNSFNNNLSAGFNSTTQPDIRVTSWGNGIVPGFNGYMNYTLNNLNNVNGSGILKATLPSAFIPDITLVTPSTYTLSGDTVMWTFTNLNYTNNPYASFIVQFTTPISTPLGSIFTSCAYAQTSTTDFNPINNTYCYYRTVTGSFDPNDKTPNPVGVGSTGDIAASVTDLTYLIRFQNTGNGPAVNIVVKDTLSPNVDVNTFEMLGSSHNYNIEILPGNILKWKFNNIMLPDSNSNEPASHGYIQYRVKRNPVYEPGTQIKNTAYIYFDFNEPVVTNTAINTIAYVTDIKSSSSINDGWNVYPNPSTGALYIVNSSSVMETSQVQVLNAIGQVVLEETITSNYKNIDLSKLNNGVYFVKISSENNSIVKRVVLKK
ncbi:MAG TPA: T9SS type A sorting domain-containing protein [Bacteroidia bacterium]|nr:T9SS type A sorting domain-containing protein [Bacteroidia bacterium]